MEKRTVKSKIKSFLVNLALNLTVLIPGVLFVLATKIQMGMIPSLLFVGAYIIILVALPMIINIRYCNKNSVYCFVHWWVIMAVIAELGLCIQLFVYLDVLKVDDAMGGTMLLLLYLIINVLIIIASLIYQVILIIKYFDDRKKSTAEAATE